jgi:hypothetical protein
MDIYSGSWINYKTTTLNSTLTNLQAGQYFGYGDKYDNDLTYSIATPYGIRREL